MSVIAFANQSLSGNWHTAIYCPVSKISKSESYGTTVQEWLC